MTGPEIIFPVAAFALSPIGRDEDDGEYLTETELVVLTIEPTESLPPDSVGLDSVGLGVMEIAGVLGEAIAGRSPSVRKRDAM